MSSSPESEHLDNRHRDTLRQIFAHPTSHNVEWHAVMSLLDAVGTTELHHDGKFLVKVGSQEAFLERPAHKDIDVQMVIDLRHMLTEAGYAPS